MAIYQYLYTAITPYKECDVVVEQLYFFIVNRFLSFTSGCTSLFVYFTELQNCGLLEKLSQKGI